MNKQRVQKKYHFISNQFFQTFDQFRLTKHQDKLVDLIYYPSDKSKKVKSLILGCNKRYNKLLYKGLKYYIQDLQKILDAYPIQAPSLMKQLNINLNKTNNKVNVQCHNCAKYTDIWKYCPTCQNVHYCHQGCEMQIKFTHQRQQCRIRPYPKMYKPLQVEIHIGSDLGRNVHLHFQHQVSMSLLLRGQKFLQEVTGYFSTTEGNALLDDYKLRHQNKMIKFVKQIKNPPVGSQNIVIQNIQTLVSLYTDNKILRQLQLFLLENGAILWKNVRQIHDNHFREIYIFHHI